MKMHKWLPEVMALVTVLGFAAPSDAAPAVKVEVHPKNPMAGDPVLVTVQGVSSAPAGTAAGKPLWFFSVRGGWQAVFALPLEDEGAVASAVPLTLQTGAAQDGREELTVEVRPRNVSEDHVEVDPAFLQPTPEQVRRIAEENEAVVKALKSDGVPQFTSRFGRAGAGKATSGFGGWRTFNGGHRSRHLGLDLAARTGAPVKSINAGTVSLVADTFLMGTVVVIDHGGGIGSTYFHLSEAAVKQGDAVKKGQRIGAAGEGGRTSGPHIHLSVWVRDAFVDPATFAQLPLLAPKGARRAGR